MASRSPSFQITLVSILSVLLILGVILLLLTRQKCLAREGFVDVPRDISHDHRDDVGAFLDKYITIGDKVCPVENYILDGIAKTTKGAAGGGEITNSDLVSAKVKANSMANGQLFDCTAYTRHKELLSKDKITIKDVYDIIDDLPDNIGYRLWHTAKFSSIQLKKTYSDIKATLTAATTGTIPGVSGTTASAPITRSTTAPEPAPNSTSEGFEDAPSTGVLGRCKTKDLCPEEMAAIIEKRIQGLMADISKAETGFDDSGNTVYTYLTQANDFMDKLTTLKAQAENGTLIAPQLH